MTCSKCRDDGFYYTMPDGVNPFLAGAEGIARMARRVECECGATRQDIGGGRCRYEDNEHHFGPGPNKREPGRGD